MSNKQFGYNQRFVGSAFRGARRAALFRLFIVLSVCALVAGVIYVVRQSRADEAFGPNISATALTTDGRKNPLSSGDRIFLLNPQVEYEFGDSKLAGQQGIYYMCLDSLNDGSWFECQSPYKQGFGASKARQPDVNDPSLSLDEMSKTTFQFQAYRRVGGMTEKLQGSNASFNWGYQPGRYDLGVDVPSGEKVRGVRLTVSGKDEATVSWQYSAGADAFTCYVRALAPPNDSQPLRVLWQDAAQKCTNGSHIKIPRGIGLYDVKVVAQKTIPAQLQKTANLPKAYKNSVALASINRLVRASGNKLVDEHDAPDRTKAVTGLSVSGLSLGSGAFVDLAGFKPYRLPAPGSAVTLKWQVVGSVIYKCALMQETQNLGYVYVVKPFDCNSGVAIRMPTSGAKAWTGEVSRYRFIVFSKAQNSNASAGTATSEEIAIESRSIY